MVEIQYETTVAYENSISPVYETWKDFPFSWFLMSEMAC